jgi:hypothetical protein
MDQPTQNQETFYVKVAGPYYDRILNRWRLRLVATDGIEFVTELDRTGRSLNEYFGRHAVIKGVSGTGPNGERTFELVRFDVPGSRSSAAKEDVPPDGISDDLSWNPNDDDDTLSDDDVPEEEDELD